MFNSFYDVALMAISGVTVMLFLYLVMALAPLSCKYLFLYDFQFIHLKAFIDILEKGYLNFWKHPLIVLWKVNWSECFCILSSKISRVESFSSTLSGLPETLPKSFFKQLFCREPVSAYFCKKELHSTCYFRNFSQC